MRAALIAFGVDASHGYERSHIDALISVSRLTAVYVASPLVIERDVKEFSGLKGFTEQP